VTPSARPSPGPRSGLAITDLRVHSIAVADPPLRSSYGLHAPYALRTVLELVSDSGLVGISETHGGDTIAGQFAALRERLIGQDAFTLMAALLPLIDPTAAPAGDRSQTYSVPGENPLDAGNRLFSAIEIACLDLIGQALGRPVCDLFGGRARTRVPFSAYLFYKHAGGGGEGADAREDEYGEGLTPQAMVRQAKQMCDAYGFTDIKLKAGVLDPPIEIATIKALHEAFGDAVPLRIDPNCAWSVETSLGVGRALYRELGRGGYLEDPCAGMDGMAAVRKALLEAGEDTPLASNVAVTSFADLPAAIRTDAVQVVLCDPHYWGGVRQIQHLSKLCQTFGVGLSMHSNSHLGLSLMAMAHAAAAAPYLTYACDTHYPWQHAADEIVEGGRLRFDRGCVVIPDRPGLGVTLDQDALARGRERYATCPYQKRDDQEEMRKHVDPTWTRRLPRW
jgi:glucarate dehydratase